MPLLVPAPSKTRTSSAEWTLVIADHDPVLADVMRRYLLLRGFEVETATGGIQCLDKLHNCDQGILILDHELRWGGSDGVLAIMREDPFLSRIPVILTSTVPLGECGPGVDSTSIRCQLVKPFALQTLFECILSIRSERQMMGDRRAVSPRPSWIPPAGENHE